MKKTRHSDEQIVRILREADQMPVAKAAKKHGVNMEWFRSRAEARVIIETWRQ